MAAPPMLEPRFMNEISGREKRISNKNSWNVEMMLRKRLNHGFNCRCLTGSCAESCIMGLLWILLQDGRGTIMKTLVAYFTQTGNTGEVAEAIFGEIEGEKEMLPISELANLEGYDLIFYGFPIQAGHPAKDAADFLTLNGGGKKVALFATHGAPDNAERVGPWLEGMRTLATAAGAELLGLFHCQGEASQDIVNFLLASDKPEMQMYGREAALAKGFPDEAGLTKAREYAREILTQF